MNNQVVAHTVHINSFKLVYNEHLKSIGEFIEILANTGVLNCLLEFLAGNFPILEVGFYKVRFGKKLSLNTLFG